MFIMGLRIRIHCIPALMTLLLVAQGPCFGITKIAVFPLVNKAQDKTLDWLGSLVPEYFSRHLQARPDVQVLEPTFLFPVDSAGWTMESDSVLRVHRLRWEWDAACGGAYAVINGRIACELRTLVLRNGAPVKKVIALSASPDSLAQLCFSAFTQYASLAGWSLTKEDYQSLKRPVSRSAQANATYLAGYGYEMHNNAPAAITSYARAVELDPSLAQALCRMARLFSVSGAVDKARPLFDRAVSAANGDPLVAAAAADFYVEHDLPARSSDFVKKNRAVLEQTAAGMAAMGKSLLVAGEAQRAVAMLTRAVARGPSDLDADFELGNACMVTGRFSQACDVFNRLVKYRPDYPRFYALLGASYRRGGLMMEASRVLEYGAKNYPDNIPVLVNLAQTYIDLAWYDKARQVLMHAQDLDADLPDIYVNLGVLAWHEGKLDDANRLLEKAARMGTNVQSALNNEGNILYVNGNAGKALDEYKKADRAGAKNESVLSNLANAYLSLGRLGDAEASLEALRSLSPGRVDVLQNLASLAEKRGKDADAVTYYRRLLELSPHDGDALVNMTALLIKLGEYKDAVDPLEAFLADHPADKKVLLMQADVYRRMGWYEVAVMKYQAITNDFANDAEGFLGMGRTMYDMFQFKGGAGCDSAISYLKKALALGPANPEPEYLMGLFSMNCERHPGLARDQWRAALSKATDPVMKTKLSELMEKADQ